MWLTPFIEISGQNCICKQKVNVATTKGLKVLLHFIKFFSLEKRHISKLSKYPITSVGPASAKSFSDMDSQCVCLEIS